MTSKEIASLIFNVLSKEQLSEIINNNTYNEDEFYLVPDDEKIGCNVIDGVYYDEITLSNFRSILEKIDPSKLNVVKANLMNNLYIANYFIIDYSITDKYLVMLSFEASEIKLIEFEEVNELLEKTEYAFAKKSDIPQEYIKTLAKSGDNLLVTKQDGTQEELQVGTTYQGSEYITIEGNVIKLNIQNLENEEV